ncbi:MAG: GAF domain-containing protein, partial [Anaerolineales bacterium]|nr:GAF domain-containing protein [Anaerolineales bacterium]
SISHKNPRIALDVGVEAVHFNNPHLPQTRSEMAIPLLSGEEVLGALSIQSSEPLAFDEDDITALEGISSSLATSLKNVALFKQLESSLEEIQASNKNYLARVWSEDHLDVNSIEFVHEGDGEQPPLEDLSTIAIPLTLREQVIGELMVETEKQDWTPEEAAFIEAIANQAAVAMENARLLEETQFRVEQERIITDIVGKLYATSDINQILRTGLQELSLALNASEGEIYFGKEEHPEAANLS